MKRFLLLTLTLLLSSPAVFAVGSVWTSSHTATADSLQSLCGKNNRRRALLHTVCINDAPAGTVTLFDGVLMATNTIAVIRSTSAVNGGCFLYDVQTTSGVTYTTSQPMDVTFSFSCY